MSRICRARNAIYDMAMGRRWRIWLGLAFVLVLVVAYFHPGVYWPIAGWLKGEAFYQGYPTSYWSRAIPQYWDSRRLEDIRQSTSTPACWVDRLMLFFNLNHRVGIDPPFQIRSDQEKDPAAVPVLVELLEDKDDQVCFYAANALGLLGHEAKPAVPTLIKMLSHPDVFHRRNAVHTLAAIGSEAPSAVPALIEALNDRDEEALVIDWAVLALGFIGPEAKEAVPNLIELLKSDKATIEMGFGNRKYLLREQILWALQRIDPDAAARAENNR